MSSFASSRLEDQAAFADSAMTFKPLGMGSAADLSSDLVASGSWEKNRLYSSSGSTILDGWCFSM